ncbi:MAG: UDP-3-O-(3-hydroxymyristoyl)glucosamine N-acyltransferase [candidate division WOR-3 bacterium]
MNSPATDHRLYRIESGARIAESTFISPLVYIGPEVEIGPDCFIAPQVTIMGKTVIGARVRIGPGAVIGWEGFGYQKVNSSYHHLEHNGMVIIEDDVEIGPLVSIARAKTGRLTRIGRGTKIDALVHIAHNVVIGENCIISGQSGIAGSTRLGDGVIIAGQSGISDHIIIGANSVIYAKSAVFRSIPPGSHYWGIPARPKRQVERFWAKLWQQFGHR